MRRYTRSASLAITFAGLVTNTVVALIVFSGWTSSGKFERESEWESTLEGWRVDGVKLLWGLLSAYFSSAALVCGLGLWGILKNRPTYIRFYRDYTIADFCFCAFFIALATYGCFRGQTRAGICEHFSHYPELMRDMSELGLSVENCELWLENAVVVALMVLFVIMAVRLHFLLALSAYYAQLMRHHQRSSTISCSIPLLSAPGSSSSPSSSSRDANGTQLQRIYLLPRQANGAGIDSNGVEMVYAPVPLDSLPLEMQVQAMEAWVQRPHDAGDSKGPSSLAASSSPSASSSGSRQGGRGERHHRRRSGSGTVAASSEREGRGETGRIRLAVQPEEGLLPSYTSSIGKA